jgi:hypothetical protein
MADVDALLSQLRPEIREPLAAALAATRASAGKREQKDEASDQARYGPVLDAVGLSVPPGVEWSRRPIPPASELNAEQRTVAEILARTPGPYLMQARMPAPAWVRRQWLGIDPPGPLFRIEIDGVPLYHAVREVVRSPKTGWTNAAALLAGLPDEERTAALCDLRLAALDLFEPIVEPLLQKPLPDRGKGGRAWAIELADRLVALFTPGAPMAECGNRSKPSTDLARAAFVSLVNARVPIEPRWDALLTLESWMAKEEREACVRAIPEERREAAVAAALFNPSVEVATDLLPRFPFACLAAYVVARLEHAHDAQGALDAVRAAAKRNAAIVEILAPVEKKLAKTPTLRVTARLQLIVEAELDATARKQLEAANRRYGGHKMTTREIFAAQAQEGEVILPRLTERLTVEDDNKKHVYDVWLYMGDSGTVFKAGRTVVVAEIVQGGLECKSLALKLALKAVLAAK